MTEERADQEPVQEKTALSETDLETVVAGAAPVNSTDTQATGFKQGNDIVIRK